MPACARASPRARVARSVAVSGAPPRGAPPASGRPDGDCADDCRRLPMTAAAGSLTYEEREKGRGERKGRGRGSGEGIFGILSKNLTVNSRLTDDEE